MPIEIQLLIIPSFVFLSNKPNPTPYSDSEKNKGKKKSLTKLERAELELSQNQKDIIVGSGLGGLYLEKRSSIANARLVFRQGKANAAYITLLFSFFKDFCAYDQVKEQNNILKSTNKS